jgi:hypothetical protein
MMSDYDREAECRRAIARMAQKSCSRPHTRWAWASSTKTRRLCRLGCGGAAQMRRVERWGLKPPTPRSRAVLRPVQPLVVQEMTNELSRHA